MSRHPNDIRSSTPAVQRARERIEGSTQKGRSGMDVKVEELDEGGVDLKETIATQALSELLDDGKSPRWTGGGDATLELHLEREASFVRVTGTAKLPLVHPCVRCLNEVPFDIDLDVDLRLVQRTKPHEVEADYTAGDGSDDLEGAPLGSAEDLEDLDIASYEGDVIHVGEVLREQLFLDLPMHPACDSPRAHPKEPCAFDAKQASSEGSRGFTDARWAGLASLRDKLPPGPAKNGTTSTAPAPTTAAPKEARTAKATSTNAKPATKTLAKTAEPAAQKAKPAATKVKPAKKAAAKKAKPVTKNAKPAAKKPKKAKPAPKKAKPAPKKAKPAAKNAKPAAKKSTKKKK
jgi:uncharacterized metal-binding protein YceD (DUF177 family)